MNFSVPCFFVTFYSYMALFDNVIMVKTKFLDDFTKTEKINGIYHRENQQVGRFYLPHRLLALITQKVLNFLIILFFYFFLHKNASVQAHIGLHSIILSISKTNLFIFFILMIGKT